MTQRTTGAKAPGSYDRRGSSRTAHPPAAAPDGGPAAGGTPPAAPAAPAAPPPAFRRRRRAATAALVAGGALALGLGTAVVLLVHTDRGRERVRRLAERTANRTLAGRLHLGRVGFGPGLLAGCLSGACTVRVDSLAVRAPDGTLLLAVRATTARVALLPLLRGGPLVVTALALDGPQAALRQRADGRWDWQTLLRPDVAPAAAPRRRETVRLEGLTVRHGALLLETAWAPDPALAPAARDAAVRAALARPGAGIHRLADGRLVHRRRLDALDAALPLVAVRDDGAVVATVDALAFGASDPALALRALRGTLRLRGDTLRVDVPALALARAAAPRGVRPSTAAVRATITWRDPVALRYSVALHTGHVALADLAAALGDPAWLPRSGDGAVRLRLATDARRPQVVRWTLDSLRVRSGAARLDGALAVRVGDRAALERADLTLAGADPALLASMAGAALPAGVRAAHGTLGARLVAHGDAARGDARRLALDTARLAWTDAAGTSRLAARGALVLPTGGGAMRLDAVRVTADAVELAHARLVAPTAPPLVGRLTAAATLDGPVDAPRATALAVALRDPAHPAAGAITAHGAAALDLRTATPRFELVIASLAVAPAVLARSIPALSAVPAFGGTVRAHGTAADVRAELALAVPGTGVLRATARLRGAGTAALSADARGRLDEVDPAALARILARSSAHAAGTSDATWATRLPAGRVGGTFDVALVGADPTRGHGHLRLALDAGGTAGPLTLAPSRVAVRWADGRLLVDTLHLATSLLALDADGAVGLRAGRARLGRDTLRLTARLDSIAALARLAGLDRAPDDAAAVAAVAADDTVPAPWAGRMALAARVVGDVDSLAALAASLRVHDLRAPGLAVGALDVDIDGHGRLATSAGITTVRLDSRGVTTAAGSWSAVRGAAQAAHDARATRLRASVAADPAPADSAAGVVDAPHVLLAGGATWRTDPATRTLRLDALLDTFALARRERADTLRLVRPAALRVDDAVGIALDTVQLRLSGPGADPRTRLWAVAAVPAEGALRASVHLDSIPLGAIDRLAALDLTAPDGTLAELAERTVSLQADLAGTRAAPTLDVLGALHPRTDAASGFGDLSMGDRAPVAADTAVTGLDQLLDGALLRARVADGRATAFVGLLAPGRALARLDAEAPVAFSLAPVRAALVEGPTRVVLRADSVELAAVGRAFPDAGLRGGLLRLDAHAEGTRLPLTLSGALAVSDGAVDVASFGVGVRRLTADVRLAGDSITIAALHGESATPNHHRVPGRFDVGGVVRTKGADGRATLGLDFTLAADRLPVLRSRAQGDVDASARLTLRGPLHAATLGGRATVDRAELRLGPLGAPSIVGVETPEFTRLLDSLTARPPGLAARLGEALVRNLRFEGLRLAMGEDVWLRSPEVDVQLAGSVQVNHAARRDGRRAAGLDLAGLALEGDLAMPRGTYRLDAGVIQRVFELQKGALHFGGGAGLDPDLDLVAAYTARRGADAPAAATALSSSGSTVTALATIGGTVSHPTLTLSSGDGAMTQEQVLSWLVTGQATFDPASADAYRRIAGTEVASRMATALADRVAGGFFDLVRVTPGSTSAAGGAAAAAGEGSSTLGGGAQSFTASRLALGKQIGRRAFLNVNAGTCGLLGGGGNAGMNLDAAQFSNALGLTLDYRLRLDGGVRVSSEPSGAALTCNATASSPTGVVTPRQWALDVFRSWRF